jgi:hypothetical protein
MTGKTMTATAFDTSTATLHVPANDSATDSTQRLLSTGLNWRESPQSLIQQSIMKAAGSYPTLVVIGAVYDDEE